MQLRYRSTAAGDITSFCAHRACHSLDMHGCKYLDAWISQLRNLKPIKVMYRNNDRICSMSHSAEQYMPTISHNMRVKLIHTILHLPVLSANDSIYDLPLRLACHRAES